MRCYLYFTILLVSLFSVGVIGDPSIQGFWSEYYPDRDEAGGCLDEADDFREGWKKVLQVSRVACVANRDTDQTAARQRCKKCR